MSASQASIETMRRCGRTFWVASLLLPRGVRHDLATLYAFCREVDDIADERDASRAGERLDAIERAIIDGQALDPVTDEFRDLAERRGIPHELPVELIRGVRADLGTVAIQSQGALLRYCYRVASTVGLMICRVLEAPKEAHPFAIDLGVAMQLTNIARDVGEDARVGRVYIPASWIDHAAVRRAVQGDEAALEETFDAALRLLDLAERYYRSSDDGIRLLPRSARLGILAASRNYENIGAVIRRRGAPALRSRSWTSPTRKLVGVAQSGGAIIAGQLRRSAAAAPHDDSLHEPLASLLAR